MVNRKRNKKLGLWLTSQEKQILKDVATIKRVTITELIIDWAKNDYEKLMQRKEE